MFNSKDKQGHTGSDTSAINLIAKGTNISGDIVSSGDLRIDGTVTGTVSTKGKLVVGASGVIDGEISCGNADVSGTINAKIIVAELLTLKSTAKLTGDISTNKLAIEPGANYTGSCSMGGIVKDFNKHGQSTEKRAGQEKTA